MNLQLEIIQYTQRIAGALRGLLALIVLCLTPSVACFAGSPPARGPFAFTGGRMWRRRWVWGRGHDIKAEEDSVRTKSSRLHWGDQHYDKGAPFHRPVGPP